MRSVRRGVVALLAPALLGGAGSAVALALVLGPTAPVPAAAATRPCVGMIVDGRLAGGSLRTGCATGDPRSGLAGPDRRRLQLRLRAPPAGPGLPDRRPAGVLPQRQRHLLVLLARGPRASTAGSTPARAPRTYDPEPGDTEAWVWQEGGKRQPPDIAFGTLCPQAAAPTSSPPTRRCRRPRPSRRPPPRPTGSGDVQPLPDLTTTPPALKPSPSKSATDVRREHRPRLRQPPPRPRPAEPSPARVTGREHRRRRRPAVGRTGGRRRRGRPARRRRGRPGPAYRRLAVTRGSCARCTPARGGCGPPGWRRRPAAPPTRCCSG